MLSRGRFSEEDIRDAANDLRKKGVFPHSKSTTSLFPPRTIEDEPAFLLLREFHPKQRATRHVSNSDISSWSVSRKGAGADRDNPSE